MTELKPCPFCGGEAKLIDDDQKLEGLWCRYVITCPSCAADYHGKGDEQYGIDLLVCGDDLDVVMSAWNTRSERTCMLASTQLTHHAPSGNTYHTCRIVCSECRHDMPEHGESIKYCPWCGAKVVSE